MKVKEKILEIFNETGKLVFMSESELRQYLYERFEDSLFLTCPESVLDAAINGVLKSRSYAIEHLLNMLPENCVYADSESV